MQLVTPGGNHGCLGIQGRYMNMINRKQLLDQFKMEESKQNETFPVIADLNVAQKKI